VESVLLSKPFEIRWGGWSAMSTHLQQAGWEISAEEDFQSLGLRIALRHRDFQMYGMSEMIRFDYFENVRFDGRRLPTINIQWMVNKAVITSLHDDLSEFRPIDARPQMMKMERKDIEDFSIFATPLVRTEEIIIEPETVAECMEIIKKIQKPEQEAIRDRRRLAESREGRNMMEAVPRQKFHAQILSIVN